MFLSVLRRLLTHRTLAALEGFLLACLNPLEQVS
jgi:hypothetical protein